LIRNDPTQPVRALTDNPAVTPAGDVILRYFSSQATSSNLRLESLGTYKDLPRYRDFATSAAIADAQKKPVRMLAVLFDVGLPQIPSIEQQFAIMHHYAASNPRILWEGWIDTAVQWLRPEITRQSIRDFPVIEYAMYNAEHASHVALSSLSFLAGRADYMRLSLLAATTGKTLAVVDAGVDTLRFPHQLPALAATFQGPTSQRLTSIIGAALTKCRRAIGWKTQPDSTTSKPDRQFREAAALLRKNLDAGNSEGNVAYDEERCRKMYARLFPFEREPTTQGSCQVLLSSFYLAERLAFPRTLNRVIARSLVQFGGLNVLAGEDFKQDVAESLFHQVDKSVAEAQLSLLHARSRRYAAEVSRIMRDKYVPPLPEPWVLQGLAECPAESVELRPLPDWLREADEYMSAREIIKDIRGVDAAEDDEVVVALARILCQSETILRARGEETVRPPAKRSKPSAVRNFGSSSTARSSIEKDSPATPSSAGSAKKPEPPSPAASSS
jgi:hypothetical protein